MALFTTTADVNGLLPDAYAELVINPLREESVAFQVATQILTESNTTHIPVVQTDAGASWVAEGGDLTSADAAIGDVAVVMSKVGGMNVISSELADDSNPAAHKTVGQSLARSVARQVDAAFFGNLAAPAPAGMGALTGANVIDAGDTWTSIDAFLEARADAEDKGAEITAWVANSADALALAKINEETGSQRKLLQPDATNPTIRRIDGIPMHVSAGVPANTIYGIPKAHTFVVISRNGKIEVSRDAFFATDQVAVKCTSRVGFGFPHATAMQKINVTPI